MFIFNPAHAHHPYGLQVTISGSFRKYPDVLKAVYDKFFGLGAKILSPQSPHPLSEFSGFVSLKGDPVTRMDRVSDSALSEAYRLVENGHLEAVKRSHFLWLMNPGGYMGTSTSLEIGWALAHGIAAYTSFADFVATPEPMMRGYVNPVPSIEWLVAHYDPSTAPKITKKVRQEAQVYVTSKLTGASLNAPSPFNALVAVGAIIEDHSGERKYDTWELPDLLFFECAKWGGRHTVCGGKKNIGETLESALTRELCEETALPGTVGSFLCAFNKIKKGSGYHLAPEQDPDTVYIDRIFRAQSRGFVLNSENQRGIWVPGDRADKELDLEPNALTTYKAWLELKIQSAA